MDELPPPCCTDMSNTLLEHDAGPEAQVRIGSEGGY